MAGGFLLVALSKLPRTGPVALPPTFVPRASPDTALTTREDSATRALLNSLPIKRWLRLPLRIKSRSLTSLQQRLMKTGGRLVKHARYYVLLLAEGHLNRKLFGEMLNRLAALPVPGG